ncbi:hypothetical protein FRC02_012252, partial [Tulasnella sp. 418]
SNSITGFPGFPHASADGGRYCYPIPPHSQVSCHQRILLHEASSHVSFATHSLRSSRRHRQGDFNRVILSTRS